MYSRGAAAIAEQIHSTKEEAQQIIDDFFESFPTVKSWMDESVNYLKENGYTVDFYGRRRRLPDILLPKYSFKLIKQPETFNPIIGCENRSAEPDKALINKYTNMINGSRFINREIEKIRAEAAKDNIEISANGSLIARAERQCVNARIQGGAATMTKIAMNKIFRDPELNSYGFKLLINVHDELIGQCKEEYADQCANRLCEVMKTCISDICSVPFKCDPAIEKSWYFSEVAHVLQDEAAKMQAEGKTREEIEEKLLSENSEFLPSQISAFLDFKD